MEAAGDWSPYLASGLGLVTIGWACTTWLLQRSRRRLQRTLVGERAALQSVQANLTENQGRLRTIIETEPECVKLHSRDGTILEINPAGLAFSEAEDPGQVIGRSIYSLIAPDCRDRYRQLCESVFSGHAEALEFRMVSLKGRERTMEMHAVPLRNAAGEITALLGLTRDVTERRRAEEQARRHLAELARVARTSTLGEMASGIAHELNQPLAAIANHAAACQRRIGQCENLAPAVAESLEEIAGQARRAGRIIRNLRDLAQKRAPRRAALDVNRVARQVAEWVDADARQRGVEVHLALQDGIPPAYAEKIEIEQVLLNLVKNSIEAADHAASGEAVVVIGTAHDGNGTLEVAVRDNGPGIPDELQEQVFNPFFTTKADGMGMGLSISRSIVETHGGRFQLTPGAERGVTFRFTLPVHAAS